MKGFGSLVLFSIFYILFMILIESLSASAESNKTDESTPPSPPVSRPQSLIPHDIGEGLATIWNQPHIVGDVLKLQGNRIVQVGTAALGLGLAMLLKMFLLWIGPILASAPVQAVKEAVAKEASRELLSNGIMKVVSTFQNFYG